MTEQAPTVVAELVGYSREGVDAINHLIAMPGGTKLEVHREEANQESSSSVSLHTLCCHIKLGYVSDNEAALIAPWIDQGTLYTATIKDALLMGQGMQVQRNASVRLVPTPPTNMSIKDMIKKHKPKSKKADA